MIIKNDHRRFSRPVTSQLRHHQISILPGLTKTPHQKKTSTQKSFVWWVRSHHIINEIFWDKSLQFTKNVIIRVNEGNRLLLNMILISIFVGFMDIAQSFAKFALNHLTMDKHLPPIKSSSSLPVAKIYQHSMYGRVFVNKRRFHLHVAKVQYSQRKISNWCT